MEAIQEEEMWMSSLSVSRKEKERIVKTISKVYLILPPCPQVAVLPSNNTLLAGRYKVMSFTILEAGETINFVASGGSLTQSINQSINKLRDGG